MSIGERLSQLFSGNSQVQNPAGTQPQPAAQQPTQAQPGNFPEQATPAMASDSGNPNVPAGTNAPAAGLDQFTELWKAPEQSPETPANPGAFNVNPQQLMEAARKIDFSKAITPDQLSAINQGGAAAQQAFAQALNTVAQTVYAQSTHATTKLIESAIARSQESIRAELPQHIKRQTVSDTLRSDNPAFSHPAAAPILGALQQQLTVKYPTATSAEISKLAQDYLTSFAGVLQPKQQTNQQPQTSSGTDWDAYLQ